MILPIATYNSEIWGTMCFPANKKNSNFIHLDNRKNPVEDLQVKFCKRVLGVSDKTTNWAVISEVRRYPTTILIIASMVKFWSHLSQSSSPLLRAALHTNIVLAQRGYNSWFSYIHRLLSFTNLEHLLYSSDLREIKYQLGKIKFKLMKKADDIWNNECRGFINASSKLDFYASLKVSFGIPPYLYRPQAKKGNYQIENQCTQASRRD